MLNPNLGSTRSIHQDEQFPPKGVSRIKCVSAEFMIKRNRIDLTSGVIEVGVEPDPRPGLLRHTVICTGCWNEATFIESLDKVIDKAAVPNCEFVKPLIGLGNEFSLTGQPITNCL